MSNKSPWPFNGYAPGNYMNTCALCKKEMERVDKRCFICLECAIIQAKEYLQSLPSNAETVDWKQKFINWFYQKDRVYFPTPDQCAEWFENNVLNNSIK
jgi:hypothetical protein